MSFAVSTVDFDFDVILLMGNGRDGEGKAGHGELVYMAMPVVRGRHCVGARRQELVVRHVDVARSPDSWGPSRKGLEVGNWNAS